MKLVWRTKTNNIALGTLKPRQAAGKLLLCDDYSPDSILLPGPVGFFLSAPRKNKHLIANGAKPANQS